MASRLELEDEQVATLAGIVDALKTERAQAEVDTRRSTSAFAEALEGASFDAAAVAAAAKQRVDSSERVTKAVEKALADIHALLDEEQRKRFAYLLRTGAISL